jgi:predicted dehydrogenase
MNRPGSNKLRTAIIGCGKVAHIHAQALKTVPESAFTAVCSRSRENGNRFASQYSVTAYTDVGEMVSHEKIDAVVVCTPHPNHAESAIQALNTGAHVIVEKPLASSLKDCDEMIAAAEKADRKLAMISQRRLYKPSLRVKKAIESGKIGKPVLGTVTMYGWRDRTYYESDPWRGTWAGEGGGVLVNQAPHQLDLLLWYMGEVDELYGSWTNLNHPYIEVEDTALAIIRFKNGALGNIIVSNSQNPALYGKVTVFGSNGATISVQTDGGAMFIAGMSEIEEAPINDTWTIPGEVEMLGRWQKEDEDLFKSVNAIDYYHRLQLEDFLMAIKENRETMVPASQGRQTVELFSAIYRSQKKRRIIKFPINSNA